MTKGRIPIDWSTVQSLERIGLMRRIITGCLFAGMFSALIAPPLAQTSARPLPANWYEDDEWHLEVRYLITRAESDTYRQVKTTEARERFIAEFWARRDTTPGTSANEFRQ